MRKQILWFGMFTTLLLIFLAGQRVLLGAVGLRSLPAANTISTAFAYQGSLSNSLGAITGSCDLRLSLYAQENGGGAVAGPLALDGVAVQSGIFSVQVDFGAGAFIGENRWLETAVRCPSGQGAFATLAPRQAVSPTPYAVYALTVPDGSINGVKLAAASVTDQHLALETVEVYLGANTGIAGSSSLGSPLLSLPDMKPGKYIVYGLASAYVDSAAGMVHSCRIVLYKLRGIFSRLIGVPKQNYLSLTHRTCKDELAPNEPCRAADTTGGIKFEIHDGVQVIRQGPWFYFTEATGWQESQNAGFTFVITLSETTTLHLAAYKGPGGLTTAVAGGGTTFGYIKIG